MTRAPPGSASTTRSINGATGSIVFAGDPRIYGRVYVGTNGRGILYGDIAN